MVEDGVDFGDEREFVDLSLFWGSEYLSASDDFIEEWIDRDFLVGGPDRISEGDAGGSVVFVDVDGIGGDVDSTCVALCIFEDSADGFFGSGENGIIRVVLTDVIILSDQVGDAILNGLDDVSHSDSFVDALRMFFKLFVGEVAFGDDEAKCPGDNVIGVDVAVDVLGGELVGGETGGGHAGCARESSSCCC